MEMKWELDAGGCVALEKEKVSAPGQEGKPGTLTFWRLRLLFYAF
jgi:hypothetical protein